MRDTSSSSVTNRQLIEATVIGATVTLLPQWVADTAVNRKIVKVEVKGSFLNIGLAWEIVYRFITGLSFPAQHMLAEALLHALDPAYHTIACKTAIGAFSGTAVALVETRLFHPLDSIKTLIQTNPGVFEKNSLRYFWQHYSGSLSAGMGLYMFRSTMTNPLSWGARAWTRAKLEEHHASPFCINILSSFMFSFMRIVVGYPFGTIAAKMQHSRKIYPSYAAEMADALVIVKDVGLRGLYLGFDRKGGMQIFNSCLRMMLFTWWVQPAYKPAKNNDAVGFFREWKNAVLKNDMAEIEFNDPWNGL